MLPNTLKYLYPMPDFGNTSEKQLFDNSYKASTMLESNVVFPEPFLPTRIIGLGVLSLVNN